MNDNQENNLNTVTPEVPNTNVEPVQPVAPVETTPVDAAPVEMPAPAAPVEPTQPVAPQPVIQPAPSVDTISNSAPVETPVVAAKKSNPVVVILLILVLIGVCGYGLYTYTDILKPKTKNSGTEVSTTTTTIAKESSNEKSFSFKDEVEGYYVDSMYLKDNKIYVVISSKAQTELNEGFIEIDGKKAYLAQSNVKDMFLVESGQSGLKICIYTDLNGQAYKMNIFEDVPFESKKIDGATNIVKAYSLSAGDAIDYILVDKDNYIISDGKYLYVDKKNNLYNSKLPDGTIINIKLKSRGTANDIGEVTDLYTATVNGKVQGLDVEHTYNKEVVGDYDELELIQFMVCTNSNGEYAVGRNNCIVD